jgi:hypothetical protein
MSNVGEQYAAPSITGIILHRAFLYELFVWLASLGKERVYRGRALDLASLEAGGVGLGHRLRDWHTCHRLQATRRPRRKSFRS